MKKSSLLCAVCASTIFIAPYANSASLTASAGLFTGTLDIGLVDVSTPIVGPATVAITRNEAVGAGVYDGAASATATYGTLRASTMVTLTNYPVSSYENCDFIGCEIALPSFASARFTDTLTIDNLLTNGLLHMSFSVDGTIDLTGELALAGVDVNLYSNTGSDKANIYSSGLSIVDLVVPVNSGVPLTTEIELIVSAQTNDGPFGPATGSTYDATMLVDFSKTVTLTELLVTDLADNPFTGISIQSESGTIYPVSPLNTIPVPAAFWLFGSGLLGLVGIARRKKRA